MSVFGQTAHTCRGLAFGQDEFSCRQPAVCWSVHFLDFERHTIRCAAFFFHKFRFVKGKSDNGKQRKTPSNVDNQRNGKNWNLARNDAAALGCRKSASGAESRKSVARQFRSARRAVERSGGVTPMRDSKFYFCTRLRLHSQLEEAGFCGEPLPSPWVPGWTIWAYRRTPELGEFLTRFYDDLAAQKTAGEAGQTGGADNG